MDFEQIFAHIDCDQCDVINVIAIENGPISVIFNKVMALIDMMIAFLLGNLRMNRMDLHQILCTHID